MKLLSHIPICTLTVAILSIAALAPLSHGAVIISSTAPTIDGGDQGKVGAGDSQNFTKSLNSGTSDVGQSFTTSTNVGGYTMNSVSFKTNSTQTGVATTTAATFLVRIIEITGGDVASSTYTTLATDTGHTFTGSYSQNDWITWTLNTPVALDANTLYGVDIRVVTGGTTLAFASAMKAGSGGYTSGRFYDPGWGSTPSATINHTSGEDMMFHVDLVAIPEPTTALLGGLGLFALLRRRR